MVSYNDIFKKGMPKIEDKNKKLQVKIKRAIAQALTSGAANLEQMYPIFFMLSLCASYNDQINALRVLSDSLPDLAKVLFSEQAISATS